MYNFEHGIENKFSFSTFSLEKKKNLSFVMAKMHLKYTVFFVCRCFDSCRYQIHALWSVTHIRCLPASHVAIDFGKNAVTTHRHYCNQGMIKCQVFPWNINEKKDDCDKEIENKQFNPVFKPLPFQAWGSLLPLFESDMFLYCINSVHCLALHLIIQVFFVNSQELLS